MTQPISLCTSQNSTFTEMNQNLQGPSIKKLPISIESIKKIIEDDHSYPLLDKLCTPTPTPRLLQITQLTSGRFYTG